MNKVRILFIFQLVAIGLLPGCSGSGNSNPSAVAVAPAAKIAGASTITGGQICSMPSIFTPDPHAQSIDTLQLSKMTGTFRLSSVALFSQAKSPKGVILNSFSGGAAIKVNAANLRDTKIQNLCNQTPASGATPYTETLPVIMTLHLPSLRVTEFDADDTLDQPATNNPTYAHFASDTQGNLSFKMAFSDKGPPYATELSLPDWLAQLPAQPSVLMLADGSIEMRIHWNKKDISTDGYLQFQQQK